MRFIESMDSGGRFFNADDKLGEIVRGDERLTAVKWCAYTAKADGKPVTVAVFDHPENFRYPARMFTMTQHFAYLSATRNEWKEPITVKAGKPLDLRFGVAVWDGEVDKKTVEKLYQRWLKLSR
jgi:Methane oxygenase PmoA